MMAKSFLNINTTIKIKKMRIFYILGFLFILTSPNIAVAQTKLPPPCDNCILYWYDRDNDSWGAGTSVSYPEGMQPDRYVTRSGDCNDNNYAINPGTRWYRDDDRDGFGTSSLPIVLQSVKPSSYYVLNSLDCNDSDPLINPNIIWYADNDHDGYGSTTVVATQCLQPQNIPTSINSLDCDDNNNAIRTPLSWYIDTDGDGFGEATPIVSCTMPTGGNYVTNYPDECPGVFGTIQGCIIPNTSSSTPSAFGSGQNYILTISPKVPIDDVQSVGNDNDVNVAITYFDGLGHSIQQVSHKQSNSGKDIVTNIEYDAFGRQTKEYLPYPSSQSNMNYIDALSASSQTSAYYQQIYNESSPFSEKELESSSLSRVTKQAFPGNDWSIGSGHEIKFEYLTNGNNEVKFLKAITSWDNTNKLYNININDSGFYQSGVLYKTITKNENWTSGTNNTTEEFKNKEGKVVLKRAFNDGDSHDTYFVYDLFGNLTYVVPPLAEGILNQQVLDDLCYQYKYDYRNRLVEKKLPGKQWEFIVYDKLDRVVATGPALAPFKEDPNIGWMITKYDDFGRVAYTGWYSGHYVNQAFRKTVQDIYNNTTVLSEQKTTSGTIDNVSVYYTNNVFPTAGFYLLTVNY